MKRKGPLVAVLTLSVFAACTLAGCGASLDREVSVQDMAFKAPNSWIESPGAGNSESRGSVSFIEDTDDKDDDETGNSLVVSYQRFAGEPAAATALADSAPAVEQEAASSAESADTAEEEAATSTDSETVIEEAVNQTGEEKAAAHAGTNAVARTAAEAIAAKQADLEKRYGVTAWSIDKEKSQVIDGAQVTAYEYSFVKEIEGVKRTYEFKTAYVVTPDTMYEIDVVGDKVDVNAVVDSIEF